MKDHASKLYERFVAKVDRLQRRLAEMTRHRDEWKETASNISGELQGGREWPGPWLEWEERQ